MRTLLFVFLILIGCKDITGKGADSTQAPSIYIYGDDMIADAQDEIGESAVLRVYRWDGSNGAMAFGECNIIAGTDFVSGDKIFFGAGYLDALWYRSQDASDQVLQACTNAFAHAKSQGASITIITPPNAISSVYWIQLTSNHPGGQDPNSTRFYANLLKSIAQDLSLEVIDLNSMFVPQSAFWDSGSIFPNRLGLDQMKSIIERELP